MKHKSTLLTAGPGKKSGPVNADSADSANTAVDRQEPFPFLNLPAELREQVYLIALQPITAVDTASIPGTPDRVRIPAVAQVSRQLRDEALHVLFRNRPVEVSLHSLENFRRALLWVEKCYDAGRACGMVIFSGRLEWVEYQFYHITLECLDDPPYFRVRTRPCASPKADGLTAQIKDEVLKYLDQKVKDANYGQEGKLSGKMIFDMIHLIDTASGRPPPESPSTGPKPKHGIRVRGGRNL